MSRNEESHVSVTTSLFMALIKVVERNELKLLGAPIFPEAIESVLEPKIENLALMTDRLKQIDSHEAMFLLRHCYG